MSWGTKTTHQQRRTQREVTALSVARCHSPFSLQPFPAPSAKSRLPWLRMAPEEGEQRENQLDKLAVFSDIPMSRGVPRGGHSCMFCKQLLTLLFGAIHSLVQRAYTYIMYRIVAQMGTCSQWPTRSKLLTAKNVWESLEYIIIILLSPHPGQPGKQYYLRYVKETFVGISTTCLFCQFEYWYGACMLQNYLCSFS